MSKDQIKDPATELALARASLEDARKILPISPRVAAREAYVAAYHAAQARIAATGQPTGTHKGVNVNIGRLYAGTDFKAQAMLLELETWKVAADYGRGAAADASAARQAIEDAGAFINRMSADMGNAPPAPALSPAEIARLNALRQGRGY